jgi:geranylgeranyl diphosphate synthase, type II
MTTSSPDLQTWLGARRRAVDAALEQVLPAPPAAPASVCEAMRYSVMAGGKRLRPLLVLAAAEAVSERHGAGASAAAIVALPAACAVELIHTYSLVHDDLPAMDNDTLRRGRPTAHVVFGEGMAILSGDGLLTEAFALLAREPTGGPDGSAAPIDLARRRLRALGAIADAAGPVGMVGGQALDLQATGLHAAPLDPEALKNMHSRKTGALIRGCALAGAILAGASPSEESAIDAYGQALGLAFQIVDDILDVEGASAELGKTAGKDAAAGKPTYPALFGLAESRRLAADCADRARAALATVELRGQLPAIADWVIGRSS